MGKAKTTGIIAGAIVAIFFIGIVAYTNSVYDDARLAELRATYFDDTDRLVVAVVLTNSNGEFTEANGHLALVIKKGNSEVHSSGYDFTKSDFLTWNNLFGGQTRGVMFTIEKKFFGEFDVYANLQTKSHYWEGLHTSFYGEY